MTTQAHIITPNDIKGHQVPYLIQYIREHKDDINAKILSHGAVLFRGFNVNQPTEFEAIAQSIDSDLKNDYLGTSPRNIVEGTQYVFSASELPPYFPIMQHCEMSFLPSAPRRLMFFCHEAPRVGGETPICDFRKLTSDMDPKIKEEFVKKGIKVIRNYCAPGNEKKDSFQLKPWTDMFQTKDKAVVEKKCAENNITVQWLKDDALRLISTQDAFKTHLITGDVAWFNHLQVFHMVGAATEYAKIARRQNTISAWALHLYLQATTLIKQYTEKPEERAMHICFADDTEIPTSYIQHVQDLIWDNMYFLKWEKGDVIVIDNFSTSHGRMPYKGPRKIYISWTS